MNPSLDWLRRVAARLGDLREDVVFLGGAVASLLMTDPIAFGVRATDDVDVIIEAATVTAEIALHTRAPHLCGALVRFVELNGIEPSAS